MDLKQRETSLFSKFLETENLNWHTLLAFYLVHLWQQLAKTKLNLNTQINRKYGQTKSTKSHLEIKFKINSSRLNDHHYSLFLRAPIAGIRLGEFQFQGPIPEANLKPPLVFINIFPSFMQFAILLIFNLWFQLFIILFLSIV